MIGFVARGSMPLKAPFRRQSVVERIIFECHRPSLLHREDDPGERSAPAQPDGPPRR